MVKLQGTAPNQVPTNADLGSLAYVDHDNVNLTAADLRLKALSKTKSQTAVDVFVYDTSKDTDGGAWRHRTQHTSWYAEAASNTRGSRKEFPAVAVIVAEATKVTIYDGDDPSLPMWMVFEQGFKYTIHNAAPVRSVAMLNGELRVSIAGSGVGNLAEISFLADKSGMRVNSTIYYYIRSELLQRNTSVTVDGAVSAGLVNRDVNDVAMTVLPDAPTDPATGLPVPTIAVATDGGISVIRNDGTVVDYRDAATARIYNSVLFDNGYVFGRNQNSERYFGYSLGSVDKDAVDVTVFRTGSTVGAYVGSAFLGTSGGQYSVASWDDGSHAIASVQGLTQTQQIKTPSTGMVAYTTSTYNTGWMPGDIKLAALADTTAETLSGSELLSAFSDASWTTATGEWTYDAANDEWDLAVSTAGSTAALIHDITATEGNVYVATATVSNVNNVTGNELFLRIENTETGIVELKKDDGTGAVISQASGGNGTYTATFVAGASTPSFRIRAGGASDGDETATLVSASVRLADPDRSVNGKGLAVHGSITKAAVATGADVVGYSGFSSSNYLEQPYNSDLDFGTGDFAVMGWVKPNTAGDEYVFDCRDASGATGFGCYRDSSTGNFKFVTKSGGSASNVTGTSSNLTSIWTHLVVSRKGGVMQIYVNGVLETSSSLTLRDVDSTSRYLVVGNSYGHNIYHPWEGSLALFRISATAPTADQIAKIYNDEKVLFQENAKATLYGTSDAVTALAHDEDTGLLHVGTSAGRSVFQGLRRINNTTTGVTTAISVSDNLVVEQ